MLVQKENSEEQTSAYLAFREGLLRFLVRQVNDSDIADDLLQEVYVKALVAEQRGQRPRHISGWLFAIARSTVADHFRSLRPSDELPEDWVQPTEDLSKASQELAECLRPFIGQLPLIYRETLVATELQGESFKSLALRLKASVPALKSRASRGRRLLKDRLLDCCRVELSATGKVLDYEKSPGTMGCGEACS